MSFPHVEVTVCPLCRVNTDLRESHIIPRFVFDWLIESSATGYIRLGLAPNLRVQDGFKQRLLCGECEARLSAWESDTARVVFRPYHQDTSAVITYGPWFAKFCASVCWRILFVFKGLGIKDFSVAQLELADAALASWSDLTFGRAQNLATFELHLVPVDVIGEARGPALPPNMNRYLVRAVEIDAVSNSRSAFVYAKLCKLIVLGFVQTTPAEEWRGTTISPEGGEIRPANRVVPAAFGGYLLDRARKMAELQRQLSARQKQRIAKTMRSDVDRVAASESLAAMHCDVMMFGRSAFDDLEG